MHSKSRDKYCKLYKITNHYDSQIILKEEKVMRKRLISMLLCATMVATMTTGCGSSDDATSQGGDKTKTEDNSNAGNETVKLTVWAAEGDQDYMKGIVEKFKSTYSDQKFDIQIGVESESTAKDTVLTDIEAAADVYSFASDQLNDLVSAGALANLEEVGEALGRANKTLDDVKNEHTADSIAAASVDGKLYAFPTQGGNSYFMWYDSSVISEDDVKTWDGLLAAAKKAGKKVGMTYSSGWYNAAFFYGAGFTTGLNADGTTSIDWNGTSPDGYKGVDVVKSMINIASSSAFQPMTSDNGSNMIASGDLCAAVSGTWDSDNCNKVWGENCAATVLPTFKVGDKDVTMAPAYGYKFEAVNAYSKNSGWATLLAEFISNEESQKAHYEQLKVVPTNKKALEVETIKESVGISAVLAEGEFGVTQLVGGKYWDPTATFGEMIAKGKLKVNDDKAIQKALDQLVSGVTAAVSE